MVLTLLISISVVALCFVGLSISILLKKNGAFPNTEISANPNMRKLGIRCAKEEEGEKCSACSIQNSCPNPIP